MLEKLKEGILEKLAIFNWGRCDVCGKALKGKLDRKDAGLCRKCNARDVLDVMKEEGWKL